MAKHARSVTLPKKLQTTMRPVHLLLLLCLGGVRSAMAAGEVTALGAIKLLPKGAAADLALVEGYEGRPGPDRWHLLVYDAKEPTGYMSTSWREVNWWRRARVSQFAETLKPEAVIGAPAVKIDSDKASKLAQEYAKANSLQPASFNYELRKDGEEAVPLWRVSCLDGKGQSLGTLMVTATKGSVVSHEGFAMEPAELAKTKAKSEKPERVDKPDRTQTAEPRRTPEPRRTAEVRRAEPVAEPAAAPEPASAEPDRPKGVIGRSLHRLFNGGN